MNFHHTKINRENRDDEAHDLSTVFGGPLLKLDRAIERTGLDGETLLNNPTRCRPVPIGGGWYFFEHELQTLKHWLAAVNAASEKEAVKE